MMLLAMPSAPVVLSGVNVKSSAWFQFSGASAAVSTAPVDCSSVQSAPSEVLPVASVEAATSAPVMSASRSIAARPVLPAA